MPMACVPAVCVHLLSTCLCEHTRSGHAYIPVHIPGHVCRHLSHHAPTSTSVLPCASKYAYPPTGLYTREVCDVSAGTCTEHLYKSWQIFSGNSQENNYSFAGYMVCVTTTQLHYYGKKAATDNE